MADDIFVGSVSVGVVPNLTGFNDRVRAELVPSANTIGRDMGTAITKGISDNIGVTKVALDKVKKQITDGLSGINVDVGVNVTKVALDELKKKISDGLGKIGVDVKVDVTKTNLDEVRVKINDGLSGIKVNVEVGATDVSIANARRKINDGLKDIKANVSVGTSSSVTKDIERALTPGGGGGGGGGAAAAGSSGFIGGIGALLKALPGGTSGSIGAVPPEVLVPAIGIAAAATPFVAQAGAGLGIAGAGAGLAGLGIAGAFGVGGQTAAQVAPLRGAASAANARVISDEARLNQLRTSGKATTAQLAAAEASLAGARNSQATAQTKYQQAQRLQITAGQEQVRASFNNLKLDALGSLNTIGQAFVPVMKSIFGTADDTIKSLTPVFAGAEKVIAGPFQTITDTVLKAFTDPQVKSAVGAVASAFADILKAFTPDIKGLMDSFADAIERIAGSVAKNPKAFADFLNFIGQFIIMVIDGIAFLTDFADYVEIHFMPAIDHFVNFWKDVWRDVSAAPSIALTFVKNEVERLWNDITGIFSSGGGVASGAASGIGSALIAPFMGVYNWVEGWFKPWWKANGQALVDIWQSTWNAMSTIVKGLVIGPVTLAVRLLWDAITVSFKVGSQIVFAVWDLFWGLIVTAFKLNVGFITAGFKIFWATLQGIFRIGAAALSFIWTGTWQAMQLVVKVAWAGIEFIIKTSWDVIVGIFTVFIDLITGRWGAAWTALKNMAAQYWNAIRDFLEAIWQALDDFFWQRMNSIKNTAIQIWNAIDQAAKQIWGAVWNDIVGTAVRGAENLYNVFTSLKQKILSWFSDTLHWLVNAGGNIVTGLLNGIKAGMGSIGSWIKGNVVDPLVNAVKHFFGIKSPASIMVPIGANVMQGLMKGLLNAGSDLGGMMKLIFGSWPEALGAMISKSLIDLAKLPEKALKALGSVGGKIGGFFAHLFSGGPAGAGVERWAGTVAQALGMLGLPLSLGGQVLRQIGSESGGNPNAINLWDSNAKAGDPSRGLLQTIGSTFSAYHVAGTSDNIYDPLANIAAAINYARHRYGPTLMSGGMGLGSGHGYAGGTGGASAGWAWVGERGPELVNFSGGETVLPTGSFGGYATGTTSVATLEAEIKRYQAQISIERLDMAKYAAGSAGAAGRKLESAQIAVNQSHINDLDKRIYAMEHPAASTSKAAAAASTANYNKMVTAGTSLAASMAKITTATTASTFASDQASFLADLKLYFTPSVAAARSQLVISQIKAMQDLQTHIKTLSTNIANVAAFQQSTYGGIRLATRIGTIGIQGTGAAGGQSILAGLQQRLAQTTSFGTTIAGLAKAGASQDVLKQVAAMDPGSGTAYGQKMITALNKMKAMKLSPEMITQLVAIGPDAALAYIDAIQAGGPSLINQVKTTEAALEAARVGTSRGITSVVSGGAYNTGANFVAGLQSQQAALTKQFAALGKTLGTEAVKWMKVPANKRPYGYATGGWVNEPVSGIGQYSGALYTFAERGREYVVPEGQMGARGGDGATQYHAHFDGLTGAAIEYHVRTAFRAMSMAQGSMQRQGRRT